MQTIPFSSPCPYWSRVCPDAHHWRRTQVSGWWCVWYGPQAGASCAEEVGRKEKKRQYFTPVHRADEWSHANQLYDCYTSQGSSRFIRHSGSNLVAYDQEMLKGQKAWSVAGFDFCNAHLFLNKARSVCSLSFCHDLCIPGTKKPSTTFKQNNGTDLSVPCSAMPSVHGSKVPFELGQSWQNWGTMHHSIACFTRGSRRKRQAGTRAVENFPENCQVWERQKGLLWSVWGTDYPFVHVRSKWASLVLGVLEDTISHHVHHMSSSQHYLQGSLPDPPSSLIASCRLCPAAVQCHQPHEVFGVANGNGMDPWSKSGIFVYWNYVYAFWRSRILSHLQEQVTKEEQKREGWSGEDFAPQVSTNIGLCNQYPPQKKRRKQLEQQHLGEVCKKYSHINTNPIVLEVSPPQKKPPSCIHLRHYVTLLHAVSYWWCHFNPSVPLSTKLVQWMSPLKSWHTERKIASAKKNGCTEQFCPMISQWHLDNDDRTVVKTYQPELFLQNNRARHGTFNSLLRPTLWTLRVINVSRLK